MQAAFYALLAIIPWAAVTLLTKFLVDVEKWPVGLVGTTSRMVTVPLLATWVLATGAGWRRLRPRGVLGWLLLMGAISIAINLLWFASLKWTPATNVAMLFRLDLVFVVLIGAGLGLERIGLAQLALVPVMLAGLALLTEIQKFEWGGHMTGDLMVIVAALGLAVNAFVIRHIMHTMDENAVALYNHAMSTIGFVALAIVGEELPRTGALLSAAWTVVVPLGIVGAVGLPLYYVALRRMDVWKLRMFLLLTPAITAAAEWPLWGVRLSPLQCLGAAIILAGLAVLIHIESRQNRKEPTP